MRRNPYRVQAQLAAVVGEAAARISIQLRSQEEAERVAAALEPDNGDFIECKVEENSLVLRAKSGTAMGLLRTVDDAIACIRATGVE